MVRLSLVLLPFARVTVNSPLPPLLSETTGISDPIITSGNTGTMVTVVEAVVNAAVKPCSDGRGNRVRSSRGIGTGSQALAWNVV